MDRLGIRPPLDAGPTALLFAATRPERTGALVLVHTSARFAAASDYPIGGTPEEVEAALAEFDRLWGSEELAAQLVPSRIGDARFLRWFAKWQRASARPKDAQLFLRAMAEVDVRPVLPLVQAPTLILHRRGFELVPIAQGRYLTSSTVRDLVVGSDIGMTDRGPHPLKGVDGTWQLFAASP